MPPRVVAWSGMTLRETFGLHPLDLTTTVGLGPARVTGGYSPKLKSFLCRRTRLVLEQGWRLCRLRRSGKTGLKGCFVAIPTRNFGFYLQLKGFVSRVRRRGGRVVAFVLHFANPAATVGEGAEAEAEEEEAEEEGYYPLV